MASLQRLVLSGVQSKTRGFALCNGLIVRRSPFLHRQISQSSKNSEVERFEKAVEGLRSSIRSLPKEVRFIYLQFVIFPMSGFTLGVLMSDRTS